METVILTKIELFSLWLSGYKDGENIFNLPKKHTVGLFQELLSQRGIKFNSSLNTITKEVKDIQIYSQSIEKFEPFCGLQIRAIKEVDKNCEWVKDSEADFFGVYGLSVKENDENPVHYCIADCKTREIAVKLANAFNIMSNYCLPVENVF